MKHNLTEAYLQTLTEEEKMQEMSQWDASEWLQYYSIGGTKTLKEFRDELINKGTEMIREKYGSDYLK